MITNLAFALIPNTQPSIKIGVVRQHFRMKFGYFFEIAMRGY
jgi:hypothetical protein